MGQGDVSSDSPSVCSPFSWMLPALILVGLVIRLLIGTLPNFSEDEAFSFFLSSMRLHQIFAYLPLDRHPPLYYLLLHGIVPFGHSEIFLRIPSILFSLVSIFLVYRIACVLSDNPRMSFGAALFSATFFAFWRFDTAARMFPMAQVFQLAGTYFWIKLLLKNDFRRFVLLSYVFFMVLASYTLYLSGLIAFGHFFSLLLSRTKSKQAWFVLGLLLLIDLPLLFLLHAQVRDTELLSLSAIQLNLAAFYPYFLGIVSAVQALTQTPLHGTHCTLILGVLTALAIAFQIHPLKTFAAKNRAALVFLLTLFPCYFAPLVFGSFILHKFNLKQRYFLLIYPYLAILLSISIHSTRAKWSQIVITACLVGTNLFLFMNLNLKPYLWGYNLKPFATILQQNAQPNTLITAYVPTTSFYLFNYYYDYKGIRFEVRRNGPSRRFLYTYRGEAREFYLPEFDGQWEKIVDKLRWEAGWTESIWLVMNDVPWMDPDGAIHARHQDVHKFFDNGFLVKKKFATRNLVDLDLEDTYTLYHIRP